MRGVTERKDTWKTQRETSEVWLDQAQVHEGRKRCRAGGLYLVRALKDKVRRMESFLQSTGSR